MVMLEYQRVHQKFSASRFSTCWWWWGRKTRPLGGSFHLVKHRNHSKTGWEPWLISPRTSFIMPYPRKWRFWSPRTTSYNSLLAAGAVYNGAGYRRDMLQWDDLSTFDVWRCFTIDRADIYHRFTWLKMMFYEMAFSIYIIIYYIPGTP